MGQQEENEGAVVFSRDYIKKRKVRVLFPTDNGHVMLFLFQTIDGVAR